MPLSSVRRLLDFNAVSYLLVLILITSPLSEAHPPSEQGCDSGWVMFNQTCFKVLRERVFASLARVVCMYDDAQLASISSNETLQFMKNLVRSEDMDQFYVGLRLRNSRYIWGDTTDAANQDWVLKSEEDMTKPRTCFVFDGQIVASRSCVMHIGFICQRGLTQSAVATCPRGTIYNSHLHLCLWVIDGEMHKTQTEGSCLEHGGTMLDFNGLAKLGIHGGDDFMISHTRFWTNITWNASNPVWFDQTSAVEKDVDLSEIPLIGGNGSCTILEYMFSNLYPIRLVKVDCLSSTAYVICKVAPDSTPSPDLTTPFPSTTPSEDVFTDPYTDTTSFPGFTPEGDISGKRDCPHGYNWKEDANTGYCYWAKVQYHGLYLLIFLLLQFVLF